MLVSNPEPKIIFKKPVRSLLLICLLDALCKTSSKAKLQQPKWISHFGQPVVQLENDSKGSEYSDSEDQIIPDSNDEDTFEAVKAM